MADRITMTICRTCKQELDFGDNGWVDVEDGTPYCSLVDEEPHVPVKLIELPTVDELAAAMFTSAAAGGRASGNTARFQNTIRGWAKLAHKVLSREV